MNAKEYLGQALNIDRSINSKLEQVASLHELATKATTLMSDMPGSPNRNILSRIKFRHKRSCGQNL